MASGLWLELSCPYILGYGHTHSVAIPVASHHSLDWPDSRGPHLSHRIIWEVSSSRCFRQVLGVVGRDPGKSCKGWKGTLPRMWILEAKRVLGAKVPQRAGGPWKDLGPSLSRPGGIASCAQAQRAGFLKQSEEGVDP